jgi:hypothetical protein
MDTQAEKKHYIGLFSFETGIGETGQFEIYVKAKTIHQAERKFRIEIDGFLSETELLKSPVEIFILDIIEIPEDTPALIYNLSKINKDGKSIVFSSLPYKKADAVAYSISDPGKRELFIKKKE